MNNSDAQNNSQTQEWLHWQNVQNTSTKYILQLVESVWFAGVTTVVCLIGIPTNVLNCIVFWRQGLRDRMTLCLFSLAFMETGHLSCDLILYSASFLVMFFDKTLGEEIYLNTIVALFGVLNGFRLTSGCVGIIISVERCLCVLLPLRAHTLIKTRTVAIIILMCFILFHGLYVIGPFLTCVIEININGNVLRMITPTQFYLDNKDIINVFETFSGTIIPIVTFAVISVATTITALKLRTAITWRGNSSSISNDNLNRQVALTKMLVLISTIYVITMIPFVAQEIAVWLIIDCFVVTRTCYDIFFTVTGLVYTFPQISTCFHFFIYFYQSSKFAKEFRKSVRGCYNSSTKKIMS